MANIGNNLEQIKQIVAKQKKVTDTSSGWRIERSGNGYWRWRWQMKDAKGHPVTYITKSGNKGYKRGSKYIGKKRK